MNKPGEQEMIEIITPKRDEQNLLACFLEKIIRGNSEVLTKQKLPRSVNIRISGGRMTVDLIVNSSSITVLPSSQDQPIDVQLKASLKTFLDIALGAGLVSSFLRGKLALKGNPLKMLRMIRWLIVQY